MSDNRNNKRKPAPGLVPGVTYSRGSMGETNSSGAESYPIAQWLTAERMSVLANWLLVIAALLAGYIAFQWLTRASVMNLQHVYVEQPTKQLDEVVLRNVLRSLQGDFLSTNLAEAKNKIGRLSWVRHVDVRREFPDTLHFAIEEHEPLARWQDALIDVHGDVFDADYAGALPVFSGPDGSEKDIVDFFGRSKSALAALGLTPVAIALSPRRAWRLTLDNGMVLELGRDHVDERLAVFVRAYPMTFSRLASSKGVIDLRYDGGFVVKNGLGSGLLKKESGQGNKG